MDDRNPAAQHAMRAPETKPAAPAGDAEPYDADALVRRLWRNAIAALAAVAILVAVLWREPMAVVGALLAGGLVLLNFMLIESLTRRVLGSGKPAPNPLQVAILAFRVVLMALMLYGIFVLPGVRPVPVTLGLSILVLAVVVEALSEALPGPRPRV